MQGAVFVQADAGVALHAQGGPVLLPDVPKSMKSRKVKRGREGGVRWAQAALQERAATVGGGQPGASFGQGTGEAGQQPLSILPAGVGVCLGRVNAVSLYRSFAPSVQFWARAFMLSAGGHCPAASTKDLAERYSSRKVKRLQLEKECRFLRRLHSGISFMR